MTVSHHPEVQDNSTAFIEYLPKLSQSATEQDAHFSISLDAHESQSLDVPVCLWHMITFSPLPLSPVRKSFQKQVNTTVSMAPSKDTTDACNLSRSWTDEKSTRIRTHRSCRILFKIVGDHFSGPSYDRTISMRNQRTEHEELSNASGHLRLRPSLRSTRQCRLLCKSSMRGSRGTMSIAGRYYLGESQYTQCGRSFERAETKDVGAIDEV